MSGFVQLEQRRVELKGNAIWKTYSLGFQWFRIEKAPECYVLHPFGDAHFQWVPTGRYHFGKDKPEV